MVIFLRESTQSAWKYVLWPLTVLGMDDALTSIHAHHSNSRERILAAKENVKKTPGELGQNLRQFTKNKSKR